MRRWWSSADYTAMVCVVFTGITVANSIMMLAGWDAPKTGPFAYVHLLSRLAIIAAVVGVFYLDDLRGWVRAREGVERPMPPPRVTRRLRRRLDAPFTGFAYAFTLVTVAGCLVAIVVSFVTDVAGGPGLYRNLLILAALLAVSMTASALVRRRPSLAG